ncbi:MAG: YgjP-like metallopeptidase domain-containing protein, partial [Verrucomicrobiota bacterium]
MKTEPIQDILRFGKREIRYCLRIAPRKKLRITVHPDLSVRIEAPKGYSSEEIQAAIQSKARWLAKQLDAVASFHPLPSPREYISGETLMYLGRQYRLRVQKGPLQVAKLKGRFLNVQVPQKSNRDSIRNLVNDWYRQKADA